MGRLWASFVGIRLQYRYPIDYRPFGVSIDNAKCRCSINTVPESAGSHFNARICRFVTHRTNNKDGGLRPTHAIRTGAPKFLSGFSLEDFYTFLIKTDSTIATPAKNRISLTNASSWLLDTNYEGCDENDVFMRSIFLQMTIER